MTEGEKMVWAAAFANSVLDRHKLDLEMSGAIFEANDAVYELRKFLSPTNPSDSLYNFAREMLEVK